MIDADLVEQPVDGTQRAERLAEKTKDRHTRKKGQDQNAYFEQEQGTCRCPKFRVCGCHCNAAKQCAGRADILAECRFAHSHIVRGSDGQHDHKQD